MVWHAWRSAPEAYAYQPDGPRKRAGIPVPGTDVSERSPAIRIARCYVQAPHPFRGRARSTVSRNTETMQPQQLLAALASGETLSGSRLAAETGVTRAAIWKQIEALRHRGVPIESAGAAGYRLPWPIQMLDESSVRADLPPAISRRLGALDLYWELDSTSSELQRRGVAAPDFSVVLAETQTAGRGRRGRNWLSPPGLNIYLSCLKRFDAGFASLSGLSLATGVIVLRALHALAMTGPRLKWPNDVLTDDGKLAGILVELSGEYQGPCAAVIGIGLNLRLTPALCEQAAQPVSDLAGLARGAPPDRNRMVAALIASLVDGLDQFERDGFAAFVDEYSEHDALRGVPLRVSGATGELDGIGAGIDARGALQLQTAAGLHGIDSADVTVRRA
jgi:BirA family biotin operon repressor/biotin-[acetyl-CoA-carboxylase] ligase